MNLKRFIQTQRHSLIQAAIFLFSFAFFSIGLGRVPQVISDEVHYVAAGMELLEHGVNTNWSSPPLGKLIIGLGVKIFGHNPYGWRIMSVLFGALSLNAMFSLGLIFFKTEIAALQVVILCFLNQFLFVQSRIATLDVFMFTFIAWGFVYYFKYRQTLDKLLISTLFLGLGLAVKWFSAVPALLCSYLYFSNNRNPKKGKVLLICLGAFLFVYISIFSIYVGMSHPFYAPPLEYQLKPIVPFKPPPPQGESLAKPSGIPVLSNDWQLEPGNQAVPVTGPRDLGAPKEKRYFDTSDENLLAKVKRRGGEKYGFGDFVQLHLEMLKTQYNYASGLGLERSWITLPFKFDIFINHQGAFRDKGELYFKGIFLFGNPIILYVGILSILFCIFVWLKKKNEKAKIISLLYLSLWLSWALIPRKSYFLFYYFPALMMLSLSLVFAFEQLKLSARVRTGFLLACLCVFISSYPLLAGVPVSANGWFYRTLLDFWDIRP